jgi:hypothetical protein
VREPRVEALEGTLEQALEGTLEQALVEPRVEPRGGAREAAASGCCMVDADGRGPAGRGWPSKES